MNQLHAGPNPAIPATLESIMTESEIYAYYKARHRCTQCHKQDAYTLNGRPLCYECAEKYQEYQRKSWERNGGEKKKAAQKQKRDELKRQHRCTYCGKELPDDSPYVRCDSCRAMFRKAKRKETETRTGYLTGDARNRWQYGQCYKCGSPLKSGKNSDGEPYHVCESCYQASIRALEKAIEVNRARGNQGHIWAKDNKITFSTSERWNNTNA